MPTSPDRSRRRETDGNGRGGAGPASRREGRRNARPLPPRIPSRSERTGRRAGAGERSTACTRGGARGREFFREHGQLLPKLFDRRFRGSRTRQDAEIPRRARFPRLPDDFPQPALHAVPVDRRTHLLRYRQSPSRAAERVVEREKHQPSTRDSSSLLLALREIPPLPEPRLLREALRTGGRRQTVRRLRPLRRRAERTARPVFVLIRARKPCVFLRRRLLGWNVRFMVFPSFSCQNSDSMRPSLASQGLC